MKKLAIGTPPPDLVDAYLGEIAKGYGVEWAPPPVQKDDSEDDVASGGLKVRACIFQARTRSPRISAVLMTVATLTGVCPEARAAAEGPGPRICGETISDDASAARLTAYGRRRRRQDEQDERRFKGSWPRFSACDKARGRGPLHRAIETV